MGVSDCSNVEALWKLEEGRVGSRVVESSPELGGGRRLTMTTQVDKETGVGGVDGNGV